MTTREHLVSREKNIGKRVHELEDLPPADQQEILEQIALFDKNFAARCQDILTERAKISAQLRH